MKISPNYASATPIGYGFKGFVEAAGNLLESPFDGSGAINAGIGAILEGFGANPTIPESLAPSQSWTLDHYQEQFKNDR